MKEENRTFPSETYYIAIDVGGTTVKLGLYHLHEAGPQAQGAHRSRPVPVLIARRVIPTRKEEQGTHIIPDTVQAVRELAEDASVPLEHVAGVGIGVPGPVLPATSEGTPVNGCVNLNWTGIRNIDAEFRALSGILQVCVLNDANAAALGELYFGNTLEAEDPEESAASAVMVTLGTGIGGGVICDGQIITGAFGAGGEIGHMPIAPSHPLLQKLHEADPSLKLSADLEYYTSATGIARMATAALKAAGISCGPDDPAWSEDPSALQDATDLQARDVFDAAKNGDGLAIAVIDFFFDTLGQGLAAVASVVDPKLFILGGGVSAAGSYLLDGVQESYRKYAFHPSRDASFRLAALGNDAGLIGTLAPLLNRQ